MVEGSRANEITVRKPLVNVVPWLVVMLILAIQTAGQFGSQAILPIGPLIQDDLHISRAQVGLFASAVWGGCVFTLIAAGWVVDRMGARLMLFSGTVVVGVFLALSSQASSYAQLVVALVLVGFGMGMIAPAATKAVMSWFAGSPASGTAMGIKQTGTSLGGAIGAAILPALALAAGWRTALLLGGTAIVVVALIGGLIYRDRGASAGPSPASKQRNGLRAVLANRNIQLCSVAGLLLTGVQLTLSAQLVLYLKESANMSVVVGGQMLALAQMSGLAGRLLLGVASDRFMGGRRKEVFIFCGCLTFVAAAVAALPGLSSIPWLLALVVAALGFGGIGWTGIFVVLLAEYAGKQSAGVAAGVGLTASSAGAVVVPPLFGFIVDQSHSYSNAWTLVALAAALASVAIYLVQERPAAAAVESAS